jgi:hypothetical protein
LPASMPIMANTAATTRRQMALLMRVIMAVMG